MRLGGERNYSRTVNRALAEFVRRVKAGRILQLAGSGLWEGNLAEMRAMIDPRRLPPAGVTVRSSVDCVIAACAVRNNLDLLHCDRDFDQLTRIAPLRSINLSSG